MARKAQPALIGAFVLGAVLLAVAGLVLFGGSRFFRKTTTLVAYFDGSLDGLAIGSPVTFNGVRIGSVTDLRAVFNPRDTSIHTPVFLEIDASRLQEVGGGRITFQKNDARLNLLIARGLRAQLHLESLVTGQLAVALNFYPNTPVRLTGLSKDYPEMPTIPSNFERLTRTLENLPLDTLISEAIGAMRSIKTLAQSPELKAALTTLDRALTDVDGLVRNVNSQVQPVVTAFDETAATTRATMAEAQAALARLTPAATAAIADYRALAQDARTAVADADAQIVSVGASLQQLVAHADATLADARSVLGQDSPLRYELSQALQEITGAARSVRTLTDYLDRHPEAVILGKRGDASP
jgi:paraquat-inducible protein B